jgi:soluble lytic murein transglycosylase
VHAALRGALALACLASTTLHAQEALRAQDPLGPARAALEAGRFDEAAALATAHPGGAPGLLGRALEKKGDVAGACAVYERERGNATIASAAASLRAARCRARAGGTGSESALAAWLEVGASPLGQDPSLLAELAAFTDAHALVPPASLEAALTVSVGPFDAAEREALSRALDVLARLGAAEVKAKASARLRDELFDTPLGKKQPAPSFTDVASALPRARLLDASHESEALTSLVTPLLKDADTSAAACEARLLVGKAQRKLRKYAAARKQLAMVAAKCTDDTKKRAAFLEARVALLSRSAQAIPLGQRFVETWPNDTLSDDLLFLIGEAREKNSDDAGARAAWSALLASHPDGDQAHDARFRGALLLARTGDVSGALSALDDAARLAGERVDVQDRALYWRARLRAFPKLADLEATKDAAARDEGLAALRALAHSRPASFYGHLARLLASAHGGAGSSALSSARALTAAASVRPTDALLRDERFVRARAFVDAGYDDEAFVLLARLELSADKARTAPDDLVAVALLLNRVGAPGAGHGLLRSRGRALLPGRPGADTALAWSVGWPRAYAFAIEPAADEAKIPRALLFGLSREESAFDAEVVSWAGAIGLCQLMPPTAREEARELGLAEPDLEALRAPLLNARLGAAHLGRRFHGMRHPLLAIAAYNAGPGAVAKWSPHGPLDAWVEQIPVEETRNYVKKVTGSWVTYSALDGSTDDVVFPMSLK